MQRKVLPVCVLGMLALGIFFTSLSHGSYEGFISLLNQIIPQPIEPGEETPSLEHPVISVWFKVGVTENEAKDLIESFGLFKYQLSDPKTWNDPEHGGVALIEVPSDSENEYIKNFKSCNIVLDAQQNVAFESDKGN